MCQQSHNKCVDVTHWLKKHVCIVRQFSNFPGGKIFAVLPYGGIQERKFTPVLLQEWYEYFLVQIECSGCWKIILPYCHFAPIVYLYCYCSGKAKNNWNELCISIGPSHPISEIGTSHIYRLKKTRNEGD